ncbi:DNA repair protein SWI5 homolog [Protopterus annectens]|uniref:DNA repair protein SWI5 homolog n=1 Tax=Protopterus annectens TaxID=7888 RepID=UPI001CFBA2BD|nr:DNA repair protein SWI5 homolog [Protopterus annectens]
MNCRGVPAWSMRKCNTTFKSPLQSPGLSRQNVFCESSAQTAILELNRKLDKLDEEVTALVADGYNPEELDRHISLLHEYNDIKDVGQLLLGKLAVIRGVSTKDLYAEFRLELND